MLLIARRNEIKIRYIVAQAHCKRFICEQGQAMNWWAQTRTDSIPGRTVRLDYILGAGNTAWRGLQGPVAGVELTRTEPV